MKWDTLCIVTDTKVAMFSQTDFQHISGTRVAMDFVEVPSIFMEYFSHMPAILSEMGKHYKTGERIPPSLIKSRQSNQQTLKALETQNQLQMALLDQEYHSEIVLHPDFDSSKVLYELSERMNPIPMKFPTKSQVQFSHLFTYGASYYSYLWSRRWASRIYKQHFEGKSQKDWRVGGELFRHEVLGIGGGRDPWIGLERMGVVDHTDREITK
jgi:mitochondrial intermediate peptidase